MTITIDPIVLAIGPISIRWFGLLALAGITAGLAVSSRWARHRGLDTHAIMDAAALAIPVGLVGARVLHVVNGWDYYLARPEELIQPGMYGLSIWGGLSTGGLATAWLWRGRARSELADAAALGLALGIAIGRIGSFLDGDGQGIPTTLPWGTQYTNELTAVPDFGTLRHPAQVYDGLIALAIFVLLTVLARYRQPPGVLFWTFLTLYAAARLAMQPLLLAPPFLLGMPLDALVAVGALGLAFSRGWFPLLARNLFRRRQSLTK